MGILKKLFGMQSSLPHCYRCAKTGHMRKMELVEAALVDMRKWSKPWSPVQNCFECSQCRRLTCWTHSDNQKPCECGAEQWVEKTYLQQELDNG